MSFIRIEIKKWPRDTKSEDVISNINIRKKWSGMAVRKNGTISRDTNKWYKGIYFTSTNKWYEGLIILARDSGRDRFWWEGRRRIFGSYRSRVVFTKSTRMIRPFIPVSISSPKHRAFLVN